MLAVYAIVNGQEAGWRSLQTVGLLGARRGRCSARFVLIETRVPQPLVPLELFRHRTLATANGVGALLAAAMFSWFFLSALYLQRVLGYTPLEVGLAFLPATLLMGAFSLGLSARVVMRFGIRTPLVAGLGCSRRRARCSSRARPSTAASWSTCCPSMILLGARRRARVQPAAARGDGRRRAEAVRARVRAREHDADDGRRARPRDARQPRPRRTERCSSRQQQLAALNGGYHAAFVVGAGFALLGLVLAMVFFRAPKPAHDVTAEAVGAEA